MDTKLKNSRNPGFIAAFILLALCSVIMLSRYNAMALYLDSMSDNEGQYLESLRGVGNDLAEANYLLYNEYSNETDRGEVLDEYGQRPFDLTKRYMDYEIFDNGDGEALLNRTNATTQNHLQEGTTDYYAFRAKYTFSENGSLAGIEVDGTSLQPEDEYLIEADLLSDADEIADYSGIGEVSRPVDVTIVYAMTQTNLDAYCDMEQPVGMEVYNLETTTYYHDTWEVICLVIIAAALLMPISRKLDISEKKIFNVPFEVPFIILFLLFITDMRRLPIQVVWLTISGSLIPGMGHGMELVAMVLNFLMWVIYFGILFWGMTCFRAVFRMKGAYWRERTLTARLFRHFRKKNKDKVRVKKQREGIIKKIRKFAAKQYDELQHLDFQDKTNRTILKVVLINFAVLFFVCILWLYGWIALVIYSVLLFFFLRKYTTDLQEKYKLLLKSTNQLAEGHLDTPIEGDIGLFNPIQDELKKIQKGFKKAVDEEVKNERMKTELVTNVSHDLRTPLTAIITYTDLLKNEKDEEKRKEYIDVLERKSLRLKVLIEDLFEISKAASKNVVMHYMKVDIVDLLKQVGLENDSKIKEANLDFRWKLPEHKLVMWLDSQKTYRIFENLIVNITKYAMPHTRVYIEMNDRENEVHISMKNVSASELNFNTEEITDRFVRGDVSRNTEGSGLGLAIAKSFVELQHGSLKISTEADLFKADITLPKMEIPPEEDQVKEEEKEQMKQMAS
ncbi:MAG TPA: HAMP domain-containing histidine kinase [Candidatus Mediterraneibacter vanvlietii]|nr:HAMP domain-containing histidine kinase [Candidatus Mediterraneibacter vanvlietii]